MRSELSEGSSTPNIRQFMPLKSQLDVIRAVRKADYSKGTHEFLLSGSVGSSKSLTLAHVGVTHALMFQNANILLGRLALPQLKATLCQKIRAHCFNIGLPVQYNESTGNFKFPNGSRMTAVSWADKNYDKLGSYEASCALIEELVETRERDFYDKILQRVGRLPHVTEKFILSATNPNSPSHWAYKLLVQAKSDMVQVFYSNTRDNPYLDPTYIDGLLDRLDEKQAQRMIYGKWVEINEEVLYYEYSKQNQIDQEYVVEKRYPIRLSYDFNIGQGKPLSLIVSQYHEHNDTWHFFDEVIIEGQRTAQSLEELESRGYFKNGYTFHIHGDANGSSRDTRGVRTDYDIIKHFLDNVPERPKYEMHVPRSNPALRERHNTVNAYCRNAKGLHKLFIYKKCKVLDEGMRLTTLKDRGQYIEDDSKYYQHCTTALGYAVTYNAQIVRRRQAGFGGTIGGR